MGTASHRWGLPGNFPICTVLVLIYHYIEIVRELLLTPIFLYNINDHEKCYPGEPVNINKQSLINIIQENNWVFTTKK